VQRFFFIMVCFLFFTLCIHFTTAQDYLFRDTFDILGEWTVIHGSWIVKDGALIQADASDMITHIARIVKQEGLMEYEFECSYVRGLEDNYGGFGIHICMNKPTHSRSWGMNKSLLLWITYDPRAYNRTDCFFLQAYRSTSPISMNFLHGDPGDAYPLPPGILSPGDFITAGKNGESICFTIQMDCETGKGRLYHPRKPDSFYPFDLNTTIEPGMYISLRTNSISIKVDNVQVRRIK
jgi:hypothetical protein